MSRRWLAIPCATALAAGCGSSSGADRPSPTATRTASATATATPTPTPKVASPDLVRLPEAPPPSGHPPSSHGTARAAFLHAVFADIEALWRREFHSAGLT